MTKQFLKIDSILSELNGAFSRKEILDIFDKFTSIVRDIRLELQTRKQNLSYVEAKSDEARNFAQGMLNTTLQKLSDTEERLKQSIKNETSKLENKLLLSRQEFGSGLSGQDSVISRTLEQIKISEIRQNEFVRKQIEELKEQIEELPSKSKEKPVYGIADIGVSASHSPRHETFTMNGSDTSVSLQAGVAAQGNAIIVRYNGQTLDMTTHYTVDGNKVSLVGFTPELNTIISCTYWP